MNWRFLWRNKDVLTPGEAATKRKAYIFFVCLIISTLFWVVSKLSQENQADFIVPVRFENFPEGELAASQSDSLVEYTLQATGARLIKLRFFPQIDTLRFETDRMSSLARDGNELHYLTSDQIADEISGRIEPGAEVRSVFPDSLFLQLVPAAKKKLPVKFEADISFASRFDQYGSIDIDPDSVTLAGPGTVLDTLEFVSTRYWEGSNLRQTTTRTLPLQFPDEIPSLQADVRQVEVTVPVEEYTESTLDLELNVRCPDEYAEVDLRLFPSSVTVSFLVSLRDYPSVDAQMFEAFVKCPAAVEDSDGRLDVQLESFPRFVQILHIRPSSVEYIILE
ncbi:MAG: hypothetical protein ACLFMU_07250 [Bacteroidales bacterium]